MTKIEDDGLRAMQLIDNGIAYEIPAGEFSTLMAHGWLARVGDGTFRLSHDHELLADPGSAGVRNPDTLAVAAVIRAALRSSPAVDGVGAGELLGDADDPDSVAHALEIAAMGAPFSDHMGHLYMAPRYKSDEYRDADFRDYGLARAVRVLCNNAKAIRSALSPTSDRASVVEAAPDIDMARHWIDRYAAGIDEDPQMDRIIAALSPRSS